MDCSILGALSGNNYVKKLTMATCSREDAEEEIRSLAQALPGNMGLEHLSLGYIEMSDETWILFLARCRRTRESSYCLSVIFSWPFFCQLNQRPLG
jgi:hypothetical protein